MSQRLEDKIMARLACATTQDAVLEIGGDLDELSMARRISNERYLRLSARVSAAFDDMERDPVVLRALARLEALKAAGLIK
jgi:hypothetical protein